MRHKRLIVVLAVLALVSLVGASAAFAAAGPAQVSQQAAGDEAGLVIVMVDPAGPAADAGIKRGDILLSINGTDTNSSADVTSAVSALTAGDPVDVVVMHGDNELTFSVTTADRNGRAYLGIQPYYGMGMSNAPSTSRIQPATPAAAAGATIEDVVADSPADAAGLQTGDVILSVNGATLDASNTLADAIGALEPGDVATLEVQRAGEDGNLSLDVTLGENPDKAGVAYLGVQYSQTPGARMGRLPFGDNTTPNMPFGDGNGMPNMPFHGQGNMPFDLPFENVQGGVVVTDVTADSPAADAGLAQGDLIVAVDGTDVSTPQEVVDYVASKQPGDLITLSVQKSGEDSPSDVEVTLGARPDDEARAFVGVSLGIYRAMQMDQMMPGQGQFQFELPFDQNPDQTTPDNGQPSQGQSPLDLLQQLFPGLTNQQNS